MKIALFSILFVLSFWSAQSSPELVQELNNAQRELSIGHDFFQSYYSLLRNQVTAHIQVMSAEVMRNFLSNYERMQQTRQQTEMVMNDISDSMCLRAVRRRWDLQISRHGLSLSSCLENPVQVFGRWNVMINSFIEESQARTNPVQNLGLEAISQTPDFTTDHNFGRRINNAFRDTLLEASRDLGRFNEFMNSILEAEDEILATLTNCDNLIAQAFAREAEWELEAARNCRPDPVPETTTPPPQA